MTPPAAHAKALKTAVPKAEAEPKNHLRVVRGPEIRRGVLGTLLLTVLFLTLSAIAAMQAVLVQGQMKLDAVSRTISTREKERELVALVVAEREAPDRIQRAAAELGLVQPPNVVFLQAVPTTARSATATSR